MINIQADAPFETAIDPLRLETVALTVLHHLNISDRTDLSLVITDDVELQRLNLEFLRIDSPTDVLSFPSEEHDPDTGNRYLGDIIISYTTVINQANQGGHSPEAELELLIIHGLLHLLGYDHSDPDEKSQMWSIQENLLAAIGNPIKSVPD